MKDDKHVKDVVYKVNQGKEEYYKLAKELDLKYIESGTNFVSFDLGTEDRAKQILNALEKEGVFVRMSSVPVLSRCIRVTVGNTSQRKIFSEIFKNVLEKQKET